MDEHLVRAITAKEIRNYEDNGVVWLRQIIDPEWAQQVGRVGTRLASDPKGSAVDFTNLGLAANSPSAVEGFQARAVWVEPETAWGSPQQLHGAVLTEKIEEPVNIKRGHYLSITGVWREDSFFPGSPSTRPCPKSRQRSCAQPRSICMMTNS